MPRVRVHLQGYLATFSAPAEVAEREFTPGSTLSDLALSLGVTGYHLGLAIVNGEAVPLDRVLRDGDEIHFQPLVGGG